MKNIKLIIFVIISLLIYGWLSLPYYSGDVKNHLTWSNSILTEGSFGLYDRKFVNFFDPNYPPLAMLGFTAGLWIYRLLADVISWLNQVLPVFPSSIVWWWQWENVQMAWLKFPAILSSVGMGVVGWQLAKKLEIKQPWIMLVILVFNPMVIYLSAVWGQIDVWPIWWLLVAINLLLDRKYFWSGVAIGLGLLAKQSLIVLVVPLVIYFWHLRQLKKFYLWLLGGIVIGYLLYLPFVGLSPLVMINQYLYNFKNVPPVAADNALNLWAIITNFQKVGDNATWFGLTWEWWGRLGFIALAASPIYWLIRKPFSLGQLLAVLNCLTVMFFFVLTRMHERYLIPAIIFESILVMIDKRYWPVLIFMTIFHGINLYQGMHEPRIEWLEMLNQNYQILTVLIIMYAVVGIYNWWLTAQAFKSTVRINEKN